MKLLRVASHLAPSVEPLYARLALVLAEQLGRQPAFEVATSYERCGADMDDVCFVCSVPYLLFAAAGRIEMEILAAPVLTGPRYAASPVYFSDVVVPASSSAQSLEDLRGGRWAFNEPFSHSGYLVVWHELVRMGQGSGYFGEMIETGFHQEALRLVAAGRVDGAAIDSQVLAVELRDNPELAGRVRVVGTIGPSTIQPVVASATRLNTEERACLRQTLLMVHNDPRVRPVLEQALVERFVRLGDDAYDDIRQMLARVEGAGVLGPDWYARWPAVTQ